MDYRYILPVLFLEYLSLSLARGILPTLIISSFGGSSYVIIGLIESFKGLFSFIFCPLIGKASDREGRKFFLLISMIGTTIPVCYLAFQQDMMVYSVLVALSGIFSATFALTFAYISDCVDKENCAPAYGVALATFGLSFTVGPLMGAQISSHFGSGFVFQIANVLVAMNVFYITFFLPETLPQFQNSAKSKLNDVSPHPVLELQKLMSITETTKIFWKNPFLGNVAIIVLLYYTAVWAMVSTLMVFVTKQLNVTVLGLGYLLSCYGLLTMFSEGVLVRILVPRFGELRCIRLGLLAYAIQAFLIAFASNIEWVYFSLLFSMLSNLVYPSICSLVTKVSGDRQGEALGSLNGIKSLTEGLGPLLFGSLMSLFEHHFVPGAPYLLVSFMALWALLHSFELPRDLDVGFAKFSDKDLESESLLTNEQ